MRSKEEMNLEQSEVKETDSKVEIQNEEKVNREVKKKPKQASGKKSVEKKVSGSAKSKKTKQSQQKSQHQKKAESVKYSDASVQISFVETMLKEFINIQKAWFEMSLQQTEMLMKFISGLAGVKGESTEVFVKMMKQNAENFVALQNEWSKVVARQNAQFTESLKHISNPSSYPSVLKKNVSDFLESVLQMQNAWSEFLQRQSEQVKESIKKGLGTDEKSRILYVTNLADSMLKNILEAQKRWLEVATGLFSQSKSKDKEKK
jgi:hypothetical protein